MCYLCVWFYSSPPPHIIVDDDHYICLVSGTIIKENCDIKDDDDGEDINSEIMTKRKLWRKTGNYKCDHELIIQNGEINNENGKENIKSDNGEIMLKKKTKNIQAKNCHEEVVKQNLEINHLKEIMLQNIKIISDNGGI